MGFRWSESCEVTEFDTGCDDDKAYELWYSFAFDTEEEANKFAVLLDRNAEFQALVEKIASEV